MKEYKIKNISTLPTIAAGIIIGLLFHEFRSHIIGMLFPLVLFPLFALRMLGAGDIKAMCAIGAVMGFKNCMYTVAFTFISGGIIALVIIMLHGSFKERVKYLYCYITGCICERKAYTYGFGGASGSFKFSYAVTAGFICMTVNNYFNFL